MSKLTQKLIDIQTALKVPKNQFNKFGNYNFRNCEDILEAVKPLCNEKNLALVISDEMIEVGGRVYVKATAELMDSTEGVQIKVSACAREAETQKGMQDSQLTGSTSSYARKYALNGLFAIDDTKDSDATNKHGKEEKKAEQSQQEPVLLTCEQLLTKYNSSKNKFELKARKKKYAKDFKARTPEEQETLKKAYIYMDSTLK